METIEIIKLKEQLRFKHLVLSPIIYKNLANFWLNINDVLTQDENCRIDIIEFTIGSKDQGNESWRISLDDNTDHRFYKTFFSILINDETMRYINRYRFIVLNVTFRKTSADWMIDIPYEHILWIGYS